MSIPAGKPIPYEVQKLYHDLGLIVDITDEQREKFGDLIFKFYETVTKEAETRKSVEICKVLGLPTP